MKPKPRTASSTSVASKNRSHRARPTPTWLKEQQDLDEMARRRCLLVLSVLSGEKPVTDAIQEAGISRGLYYQLEEKALRAMLRALAPGASADSTQGSGADGMVRRISELEAQLQGAQQERRRTERLLYLTRNLVRRGRMTADGRGRPAKGRSSTKSGARSSTNSTNETKLQSVASYETTSSQTGTGEKMP